MMLCPLLSAAQVSTPVKTFNNLSLSSTPGEFCYDGKPIFIMAERDNKSDDYSTIKIINENLDVLNEFKTPDAEITQTVSYEIPVFPKFYRYVFSQETYTDGNMSDIDEYVKQNLGASVSYAKDFGENGRFSAWLSGIDAFPTELKLAIAEASSSWDAYNVFQEKMYGYKCDGYAILRDDYLNFFPFVREFEDPYHTEPIGTTTVMQDETDSRSAIALFYSDLNTGVEYNHNIAISQTLFNKDADYEVLMPSIGPSKTTTSTIEKRIPYIDEEGYENIYFADVKRTISSGGLNGATAANAKTGEVVCTFKFPDGMEFFDSEGGLPYLDADLVSIGDQRYLLLETYNSKEGEYLNYSFLYDLSTSSAIKSPVYSTSVKVKPTMVGNGQNINVSVGNDDELRSITVHSTSGATEMRSAASGKQASINSSRLPQGMHIVGVQTANSPKPSYTKVIVK